LAGEREREREREGKRKKEREREARPSARERASSSSSWRDPRRDPRTGANRERVTRLRSIGSPYYRDIGASYVEGETGRDSTRLDFRVSGIRHRHLRRHSRRDSRRESCRSAERKSDEARRVPVARSSEAAGWREEETDEAQRLPSYLPMNS